MKSTLPSRTFIRLPMTAAVLAVAFLMSSPVEAKERKKKNKDKDRHSDHGSRDRYDRYDRYDTYDRSDDHDHHDHMQTWPCSCHDHHHAHVWHSRDCRDYLCPGHE